MTEPIVYLNGRFVPASKAHLNIYDVVNADEAWLTTTPKCCSRDLPHAVLDDRPRSGDRGYKIHEQVAMKRYPPVIMGTCVVKIFYKMLCRSYPLRLLPPYSLVDDAVFRRFANALRRRIPAWYYEP
jgi:hypothetical protein